MSSAFAGSPTNYRVAVQPTSTGNFSSNAVCNNKAGSEKAGCFYLDVSAKTATTFEVQLRQAENGALANANGALVLDYIAMPTN